LGEHWGRCDRRWRETPPGYERGERPKYRSGITLTDSGRTAPNIGTGNEGVPVPVIPEKK
jgi:hypothetical protein